MSTPMPEVWQPLLKWWAATAATVLHPAVLPGLSNLSTGAFRGELEVLKDLCLSQAVDAEANALRFAVLKPQLLNKTASQIMTVPETAKWGVIAYLGPDEAPQRAAAVEQQLWLAHEEAQRALLVASLVSDQLELIDHVSGVQRKYPSGLHSHSFDEDLRPQRAGPNRSAAIAHPAGNAAGMQASVGPMWPTPPSGPIYLGDPSASQSTTSRSPLTWPEDAEVQEDYDPAFGDSWTNGISRGTDYFADRSRKPQSSSELTAFFRPSDEAALDAILRRVARSLALAPGVPSTVKKALPGTARQRPASPARPASDSMPCHRRPLEPLTSPWNPAIPPLPAKSQPGVRDDARRRLYEASQPASREGQSHSAPPSPKPKGLPPLEHALSKEAEAELLQRLYQRPLTKGDCKDHQGAFQHAANGRKLTPQDEKALVDKLLYQQLKADQKRMADLTLKYIPEQSWRKFKREEEEETVHRLYNEHLMYQQKRQEELERKYITSYTKPSSSPAKAAAPAAPSGH